MWSEEVRRPVIDAQQILRSINVTLDTAAPERIAHFFPTAKSTRLLRSWLLPGHSSSYFVVAPYGTGKSLTAAFFIQVVENLEQISRRARAYHRTIREHRRRSWRRVEIARPSRSGISVCSAWRNRRVVRLPAGSAGCDPGRARGFVDAYRQPRSRSARFSSPRYFDRRCDRVTEQDSRRLLS